MKRKIEIFVLALALLLAGGCNTVERIKNIRVTSATLASLTPTGFRSLEATFLVGIDNPAMQVTAEDISGILYYKGKEYVDFVVDPVTLLARTTSVYEIHGAATLRPDVSLIQVLSLAKNYDLADFTADLNVTVKLRSGVGKAVSLKNLNLQELLD